MTQKSPTPSPSILQIELSQVAPSHLQFLLGAGKKTLHYLEEWWSPHSLPLFTAQVRARSKPKWQSHTAMNPTEILGDSKKTLHSLGECLSPHSQPLCAAQVRARSKTKWQSHTAVNPTEILSLSFVLEVIKSSSWLNGDSHSKVLFIQHFLCRTQHRPPSKVPWKMVLEKLSWHVACSNHEIFRLLTVARRGSCGPTKKLILLRTQSSVLCSK